MRFINILIMVILLSVSICSIAQGNPFISGKPKNKNTEIAANSGRKATLFQSIIVYQQQIYQKITASLQEFKNDQTIASLILIVAMSFFYGVLHAVGPGHGKSFAAAYFVSKKERFIRAIYLGGLIAFFHTFTSVLIVITLKFIMNAFSIVTFDQVSSYARIISFSLISIIGFVMLLSTLHEIVKKHNLESKERKKSFWSVVFSVGLIPCPGAMIILIFTNSIDIFKVGIFMVIAMSLGMAITISVVGIIAIYGRKGVLASGEIGGINPDYLFRIIEILGATLILSIGLFFLAGEFLQ